MYTSIGAVLIAVNPYKILAKGPRKRPIYDELVAWYYMEQNRLGLAPHVFKVSADAYADMKRTGEDQCILISGESGAGKTETAKHVMSFVTIVSPQREEERKPYETRTGNAASTVKTQLLNSSPLLEAFGNAKTTRNDNSSRFGKYMELQFDLAGVVIGGRVTNFLLEKSRVISQAADERCFHVFYHLCTGGIDEIPESREFFVAQNFKYLSYEHRTISRVDDRAERKALLDSMTSLGLSADEQSSVLYILGGILSLGNVEFQETAGGFNHAAEVDPASWPQLEYAASLFQVPPEALAQALTSHLVRSGGRASVTRKQLDPRRSESNRDTLAKETYKRLFDWIVHRLNRTIDSKNAGGNASGYEVDASTGSLSLGLLDIYGFEIFEMNGFEQFCINYCNEKLQQYFISLTLRAEQAEYLSEGIGWVQVEYFDNKPVCDLVEAKPKGILNVLDETCMFQNASKAKFASAVQRVAPHPHLVLDRIHGDSAFTVRHYAGDVVYQYEGFVEKNLDSLFLDLVETLAESGMPLMRDLFDDQRTEKEKAKRPPSVSTQFKRQVTELMATLEKCQPHYIRCIKPNAAKRSNFTDPELMLHQVKYLGLTENVKVRRAGFCHRVTFERFLRRYAPICEVVWPLTNISAENCERLLTSGRPRQWPGGPPLDPIKLARDRDYVIGRTKVFIRDPQTLFTLEAQRAAVIPCVASVVNRIVKVFLAMNRLYKFRVAVTKLNAHVRKFVQRKKYERDPMRGLDYHARQALRLNLAAVRLASILRRKVAQKRLVQKRETVYLETMQMLRTGAVSVTKHIPGKPPFSKPHTSDKKLTFTADERSLSWPSGKAGRSDKIIALGDISHVELGFRATPLFSTTAAVVGAPNAATNSKFCVLFVGKNGKFKEEPLEFPNEWIRDRVLRAMHRRRREQFPDRGASASERFCPSLGLQ
uniref:Myosin motor domain-containing protein n=1 Tax=Rhizochromulina marina TaxID=1034831 RepID=A0A7S2SEZ6_9STRA